MSITTKTDSASLHIQSGWSLLPCKKTPHTTHMKPIMCICTHTNTEGFYQIYIQNAYILYTFISIASSECCNKTEWWQSKEDKNTQDWGTYMSMWHKKTTTTTAVRVLSRMCSVCLFGAVAAHLMWNLNLINIKYKAINCIEFDPNRMRTKC